MKRIVTFGEIMLRISPSDIGERIIQTNSYRIEPGGSESNVAIALANLKNKVSFVTKLPDNDLSETIYRYLQQYEVDTSHIARGGNRMGIYWTENGVGPRASQVIYDRDNSAFSNLAFRDFDWDEIQKDALWFHTSGISPAISHNLASTLERILSYLDTDIPVSIDLNYRNNLWKWIKPSNNTLIKTTMLNLCSRATLLTGNESDFQNALGFKGNKKSSGTVKIYTGIAKQVFKNLPNVERVAISLRESTSASLNTWSGILFVRDRSGLGVFIGPSFTVNSIIDRVGTGDSFAAGIIHGIINYSNNPQLIIDFATALSALNHTVRGDASQFKQSDVELVLSTAGSGQIIR